MTTITAFQPPPNNTFSFQPLLDGQTCGAIVWWNTFGARWFISVTGQDGTISFTEPLIGSPIAIAIQSMFWTHGSIEVVTQVPHGYAIGTTLILTIANCLPAVCNGDFECFVDGDNSFSYALSPDPGNVAQIGTVSFDINIGTKYLQSSKLVYREAINVFEVSP